MTHWSFKASAHGQRLFTAAGLGPGFPSLSFLHVATLQCCLRSVSVSCHRGLFGRQRGERGVWGVFLAYESCSVEAAELAAWLRGVGWRGGPSVHTEGWIPGTQLANATVVSSLQAEAKQTASSDVKSTAAEWRLRT